MDGKVRHYAIVALGFFNPLTIYWYISLYRDFFEATFALLFCFTASLMIFFKVRINLISSNVMYGFTEMLLFSFLVSLLSMVLGQVLFAEKIVGWGWGWYSLYVNGLLALYSPVMWINSLIFLAIFITNSRDTNE